VAAKIPVILRKGAETLSESINRVHQKSEKKESKKFNFFTVYELKLVIGKFYFALAA
jgi:hypothetical protein